jgi:hypothetical protein
MVTRTRIFHKYWKAILKTWTNKYRNFNFILLFSSSRSEIKKPNVNNSKLDEEVKKDFKNRDNFGYESKISEDPKFSEISREGISQSLYGLNFSQSCS